MEHWAVHHDRTTCAPQITNPKSATVINVMAKRCQGLSSGSFMNDNLSLGSPAITGLIQQELSLVQRQELVRKFAKALGGVDPAKPDTRLVEK